MSDIKKVTEEELNAVKELQSAYIKVTNELGQLAIQKSDLKSQIKQLEEVESNAFDHLLKLREQEQEISTNLQEKYGSATLDLETGAIQ